MGKSFCLICSGCNLELKLKLLFSMKNVNMLPHESHLRQRISLLLGGGRLIQV